MPVKAKEKYSPDDLRSLFSYDPDSGVLRWKVSPSKGRNAGSIAGCVKDAGYVRIQYQKGMLSAHRVALAIHNGSWPDGEVDHINGDRSDNRIANLRVATHSQNMMNADARSSNKCGQKGVYKSRNKYRAQIHAGGEKIRLGSFDTAELAYAAYTEAALRLHGEYARI